MILTIVTFIIILGVLVFVHELGHFSVARKFGVKVDEFGFGFPPRIFGIKRGETLYSINWIPLGGFVKIKGESGEAKDQLDSFSAQPAWKRIMVLAAGVMMNFLLAYVLYTVGHLIGLPQQITDKEAATLSLRDSHVVIASIAPKSAAEQAGIQPGDWVIQLDGQAMTTVDGTQSYIAAHNQNTIDFTVDRQGEIKKFQIQPTIIEGSKEPMVGVGLTRTAIVNYSFFAALWQGLVTTVSVMLSILAAFWLLISSLVTTGGAGADLSGPIGVAVITGQVVKLGWSYVLSFAAILSINLGIVNILPFPALDGGRILFVIIEKIKGKPMNERVEQIAHTVGFSLLIALMVFVTYQDIVRYGLQILEKLRNIIPS